MRLFILSLLCTLAQAAPQPVPELQPNQSAYWLRYDDSDLGASFKSAGFHLPTIIQLLFSEAETSRTAALQDIFTISASRVLDGAASEMYGSLLDASLRQTGDRLFARILAAQPVHIRKEIAFHLSFEWTGDGRDADTILFMFQAYPLTTTILWLEIKTAPTENQPPS